MGLSPNSLEGGYIGEHYRDSEGDILGVFETIAQKGLVIWQGLVKGVGLAVV